MYNRKLCSCGIASRLSHEWLVLPGPLSAVLGIGQIRAHAFTKLGGGGVEVEKRERRNGREGMGGERRGDKGREGKRKGGEREGE